MESGDIVVGQTYLVHLSRRADVARHLTDLSMFAWLISGADDYTLTVTETGARLDDEPAVTGGRGGGTAGGTTPPPRDTPARPGVAGRGHHPVKGGIVG